MLESTSTAGRPGGRTPIGRVRLRLRVGRNAQAQQKDRVESLESGMKGSHRPDASEATLLHLMQKHRTRLNS